MATIKFSVPEDVKRDSEETFVQDDGNLVVTRAAAAEKLLKLRKEQRPVSDEEIYRARQVGRP